MSFYRNFLTCVCAIGLVAVAAPSSGQTVINVDFDTLSPDSFEGFEGATATIEVPDPVDTGGGTGNAFKIVRNGGQTFAGALITAPEIYNDGGGAQTVTARAYSPAAGLNFDLKAEYAPFPAPGVQVAPTTAVVEGWQMLTWNLTGLVPAQAYTRIVFFPDIGTLGSGQTFFVDNVTYPAVDGGTGGGLMPYFQDFEELALAAPAPGNTALGDDGWLLFTNVFEADGTTLIYDYNDPPDPAPNQTDPGAAFSNVVTEQGGPDQGDNQLVIFSDYNNPDHGTTRRIESNVFQEQTIGPDDVGKMYRVLFNAKKGDIAGATTANAFIKTLDPDDSFALTNLLAVDTTDLPTTWATYGIYLFIDASLEGQILQFGFSSTASGFDPSGVVYDNINFGVPPCDGEITLTGTLDAGAYGAELLATLTAATADQVDGVDVFAPTIVFDDNVVVGGNFSATNSSCAPVADNLATNGDFETGDFTGWSQFEVTSGDQTVSTDNPRSGTYAGRINNTVAPSASLFKQANVGIGTVTDDQTIYIGFSARGSLGTGAVAFAEFFCELSGGGADTACDPIKFLGGGPLSLDANPSTWTDFTFSPTIPAGADVSGGVTLQLTGTASADTGSFADVFYDDICMSIVPGVCFPAE